MKIMKTDALTFCGVKSPCYVMEEAKLRANLEVISRVMKEADVEIILAFKAFALWRSFPIFREYIGATTASSPYEARLGYEFFGSKTHSYSPAYEDDTFGDILRCSSHVTFNSFSQFNRFMPRVEKWNEEHSGERISMGLRVNPEYSEIETELYNPCAKGSRFHCHNHCESDSYALEKTLAAIDEKFSKWLPSIKWLNLGGGHLMTRKGYDVAHLIAILQCFKCKYPNLHIILEPGSAFAWQTGVLISEVTDIVENNGVKTAILNVSFTCHMPDCLEMPYIPKIRGAETMENLSFEETTEPCVYRLGGNSCLSGDFMGYWKFPEELKVGDRLIFEDMIHYTTVKTNMFNGIAHPAIAILHQNGELETYRTYTFDDYKDRMC